MNIIDQLYLQIVIVIHGKSTRWNQQRMPRIGVFCRRPIWLNNFLESVRKVYVFKQSFLDIRRIEARRRKARAVLVRFSKSFARRRHLPSHAKVLSTTHLRGMTSKPTAVSDRLTISVSRQGNMFFCACLKTGPWYPPSAKSFFRNGKLPNRVPRTKAPPSRSWILAG